eukprot:678034-Lingulodinium_polyedra.AAC.1
MVRGGGLSVGLGDVGKERRSCGSVRVSRDVRSRSPCDVWRKYAGSRGISRQPLDQLPSKLSVPMQEKFRPWPVGGDWVSLCPGLGH